MQKFKGISRRWYISSFGIIAFLFFITVIIASVALRSYYYESVAMTLETHANDNVRSFFNLYTGGTEERFRTGARTFVENFEDKDKMEVWVIDASGEPIISSNGFKPVADEPMPDYDKAYTSGLGYGIWYGKMLSGENVMALSYMLTSVGNTESGAIRFIISLEEIDQQIAAIVTLIIVIFSLALLIVAFSGSYFIKSIVNPVKSINETAKKIADGDLNARIDSTYYNDEIGDLCETINFMAREISETDRMKNDFISTISHELRTPLTAIKGWGETLLQIGNSDPVLMQRGMNIIINESGRLAELVEELLDFSRLQNGRLSLNKERIDVLAELDEAVFVFKERSAKDGIELIYTAPTECAPMDGDPNRIKQVFVNILDNAFKYTSQGGKVGVSAQVLEKKINILISDTGCGISPEDLPKVKEKFFKSNISVQGAGIGLAVAYEIVKLHDGELDIASILGTGTTVTITFPIENTELTPIVISDRRSNENE